MTVNRPGTEHAVTMNNRPVTGTEPVTSTDSEEPVTGTEPQVEVIVSLSLGVRGAFGARGVKSGKILLLSTVVMQLMECFCTRPNVVALVQTLRQTLCQTLRQLAPMRQIFLP